VSYKCQLPTTGLEPKLVTDSSRICSYCNLLGLKRWWPTGNTRARLGQKESFWPWGKFKF